METGSTAGAAKRQQWQAHIAAWQSSGLSQPEFCEQRGLTYSTFVYWRSRLKETPCDSQPVHFVPVTVTQSSCSQTLTLELASGVRVEVNQAVDLQWLRRVVEVLQSAV